MRLVRFFIFMFLICSPTHAAPLCNSVLRGFLEQVTFVTHSATDLTEREQALLQALKKMSDDELHARVQAFVEAQLQAKAYLPGLAPGWEARSVSDLIDDYLHHSKTYGDSQLHNYAGNLMASAQLARGTIDHEAGKAPAFMVEKYLKNMPEAMTLKELERRLIEISKK